MLNDLQIALGSEATGVRPQRRGSQAMQSLQELPRLGGNRSMSVATLPAQIHEHLEEAIIRGDIAPSTRLHADDIAAHYGVSRIPVREALRSLHEAGWVEIRPRHGVYVRERSMVELTELFETRSGIESHIASLAAQRRTPDDILKFRSIMATRQDAVRRKDLDALSLASMNLSSAIRAAARNSVLATLAAQLEKRARFYFEMVTSQYGADWASMDNTLVELIAAGDADAAAAKSREHVLETGAEAAEILRPDI